MQKFASDIRGWNENEILQKTWKAFNLHFSQAQKFINKSQPQQSLSNIGIHKSANATKIANGVYARITTRQSEESDRAESITAEWLADQKIQEQMQQMVKSTQQTTTPPEQINALTSTIKNIEYRVNNRERGDRCGNRGGRSGCG